MTGKAHNLFGSILGQFPAITLEEAKGVNLMERTDTKYIVPLDLLHNLLDEVKHDYRVFIINGDRMQTYESIYYDTQNFDSYIAHHNHRLNRTKIRMRHYVESELSFLEVKLKDNHLRTIKKRVQVPFRSTEIPFTDEELAVLRWPHGRGALRPLIKVRFYRIMLASLERGERVSIDLGLSFSDIGTGNEVCMDGLAVVEVKRNAGGEESPMRRQLKMHKIKASGFSKFCVGVLHLFPELKRNAFKKMLLQLNKTNPSSFRKTGT